MIIFGTKNVLLRSFKLDNETCKHCNTNGSLLLSIYSCHAHIFWIPFIPYTRKAYTICKHCKKVVEEKDFTPHIDTVYDVKQKLVKTPFWQFSGAAILVALVLSLFISIQLTNAEAKEYLAAPMPGDIYKTQKGNTYSLLKVDKVEGDSVYVFYNTFSLNQMSEVSKINKDNLFQSPSQGIHKSTLIEMYKNKSIYGVERK